MKRIGISFLLVLCFLVISSCKEIKEYISGEDWSPVFKVLVKSGDSYLDLVDCARVPRLCDTFDSLALCKKRIRVEMGAVGFSFLECVNVNIPSR